MCGDVKAEHYLAELSELKHFTEKGVAVHQGWRWRCACGKHGGPYISVAVAKDAHAEHVQESGEYDVKTGFEVVELIHGEDCQGCWKAARQAARVARRGQKYQAQASWVEPDAYSWGTATSGKVHLARVRRPKIEEMK